MTRDAQRPQIVGSGYPLVGTVEDAARTPTWWDHFGRTAAIVTGCVMVGLGDWVVGGLKSLLALLAVAAVAGSAEYGLRRRRGP